MHAPAKVADRLFSTRIFQVRREVERLPLSSIDTRKLADDLSGDMFDLHDKLRRTLERLPSGLAERLAERFAEPKASPRLAELIPLPSYVQHDKATPEVGKLTAAAVVKQYEQIARDIEVMADDLVEMQRHADQEMRAPDRKVRNERTAKRKRGPSPFRERDVTRALRAQKKAGVSRGRIVIEKATGNIVIETGKPEPVELATDEAVNEWDTPL